MNKRLQQLFIMVLSMLFCGMNGMEVEQKLSMVQRKMVTCALTKLLFNEQENVLHIGPHCENAIKEKMLGGQVYCVDTDTLNMLQEGRGYDKILSLCAYWDVVKNPEGAIENSARLLKKNGQFCAVLPYYKSPYLRIHRETLMNDVWKDKYNKDGMIDFCGTNIAEKWFNEAGFNQIKSVIIRKPFMFKSKEKLAAWIASCPEQLHLLDERYHAEFINDVVTNYLKEYPFKDGNSVELRLPYMIVMGNKS